MVTLGRDKQDRDNGSSQVIISVYNYLAMHARKIDFYSIGSGAVMVGVSRFGDGHGSQGA